MQLITSEFVTRQPVPLFLPNVMDYDLLTHRSSARVQPHNCFALPYHPQQKHHLTQAQPFASSGNFIPSQRGLLWFTTSDGILNTNLNKTNRKGKAPCNLIKTSAITADKQSHRLQQVRIYLNATTVNTSKHKNKGKKLLISKRHQIHRDLQQVTLASTANP